MSTYIIILICAIVLVAFITIDNDLKVIKENDLHHAIQHSRFLRVMDKIFNDFFEWRRWKKILPTSLIAIAALIFCAFLYIQYALPKNPPVPEIVINHNDSSLLKRGKYLAENIAICTDCHSPRNVNEFSMPVIEEQKGAGAPYLSRKTGYRLPEAFAYNITPGNIGNWSDGELYRAITTGITKEGKTLYHAMPFMSFGKADPEDIKAIIVYIRTLKPLPNKPAGVVHLDFIDRMYNRTIARTPKPIYLKDLKTAADSGKYIVTMASCNNCHTPKTSFDLNNKTLTLSGGLEFPLATGGFVHSANLTPDESGLGTWTEETFVNKFKSFRDSGAIHAVEPNTLNTVMPWYAFRNIKDEDLRHIFAYLKTLEPVYNPVVKFTKKSLHDRHVQ